MIKNFKEQKRVFYQIKIKGRLDNYWYQHFDEMTFFYENGDTVLTGPVTDQSALHGILNRIRDLNLTLIKLERFELHEKSNRNRNDEE